MENSYSTQDSEFIKNKAGQIFESFQDWKHWACKPSEQNREYPNVIPEIVNFIEANPDLHTNMERWEDLSESLIKNLLGDKAKIKIPKWTSQFMASHPVNGGFYRIYFDDGKQGYLNVTSGGRYRRAWDDDAKMFADAADAVEDIYLNMLAHKKKEDTSK